MSNAESSVLRFTSLAGLWCVVLLLGGLTGAGWAAEAIPTDAPPFEVRGTTMVPMRGVFEWLGVTVDAKGKRIAAVIGEGENRREIVLTIGSQEATFGGRAITLDVPPVSRNDVTYVPLRLVSEALGAVVGFDPASRKITVTQGEKHGYLLLPDEPIPTTYNFDRFIAIARRQEKLGDAALRARQTDKARCHYQTALYGGHRILSQEGLDNPLWVGKLALGEAASAYKAGDLAKAASYNQLAAQCVEAAGNDQRSLRRMRRSCAHAEVAYDITVRVKGKLDKLP